MSQYGYRGMLLDYDEYFILKLSEVFTSNELSNFHQFLSYAGFKDALEKAIAIADGKTTIKEIHFERCG